MVVVKALLSRLLSLRAVVVILAVVLLVPSLRPSILLELDLKLLNFSQALIARSDVKPDIAIVELPASEIDALAREPGAARKTVELLRKMSSNSTSLVGLIVERLSVDQRAESSRVLSRLSGVDLSKASTDPSIQKDIAELIKNEDDFNTWLESGFVIPGIISKNSSGASIVSVPTNYLLPSDYISSGDSSLPLFMNWIPLPFRDRVFDLFIEKLSDESQANRQALLWNKDDRVSPSWSLLMYSKLQGGVDMSWSESQFLNVGHKKIATAPSGEIYSVSGNAFESGKELLLVSLEEALIEIPDTAVIILGAKGDSLVADSAYTLLSLQNNNYVYTPAWFPLMETAVFLSLILFLVFVTPHLGVGSGLLAMTLLSILMLVGQLVWQITHFQWLPLGVALQYLLVGYVVMFFWIRSNRRIETLAEKCHEASLLLGKNFIKEGRLDDAVAHLENCNTCEDSLSLLYQVAVEQEKKRLYNDSANTYKVISLRKRRYKDADKRAQKLACINENSSTSTTELSLTQTLVMPEIEVSNPVLGRYEIERELGRGAMGTVYLGRDPKIARKVAIKTLSYSQFDSDQLKEVKQRFLREAEAAGRLDHPNIVTVYDVGEERDLAFIAMDYVQGRPLSEFTQSGKLLSIDVIYKIIADVAEAIDYAHKRKIVHRDIKPANIIFNAESKQIKVTDFGIARITDDSRTRTGDVFGSPLYMAPEQLRGQKVSGAADIYSLGATFYQLLTGMGPFDGDSLANLTYQILNRKHKSVRSIRRDLPASASRIINKALQKEPAKRYASGLEMAETLRKSIVRDFGKVA